MGIIRFVIDIYIMVIVADIILSYLPQFKREKWAILVHQASDFICRPIRSVLPRELPFDFSPMIAILLLNLLVYLF